MNITIVFLEYINGAFVTSILCSQFTLTESATDVGISTFTFKKSRIDESNFNLINVDDVAFISGDQLADTPFAESGFIQKVDSIEETEEEFMIRTKSLMSNYEDNTIFNESSFEADSTAYNALVEITSHLQIPFDSRFNSSPFISNIHMSINGSMTTIPFEKLYFEPKKIYYYKEILDCLINNTPEQAYIQFMATPNDSTNSVAVNPRLTIGANLPIDELSLEEDFILNKDFVFSKPSSPNKVILYPDPENVIYATNYYEVDWSDGGEVRLVEDTYSDDDVEDFDSLEEALEAKARTYLSSENEDSTSFETQIKVGVFDFKRLALYRKLTLKYKGKQYDSQVTEFTFDSNNPHFLNVTFGFKRYNLLSRLRKIKSDQSFSYRLGVLKS